MRASRHIFLFPILCFSTVSGSFSFLGFGSPTTEKPTKALGTVEAASSNSATFVLPDSTATTSGHTNILFGTAVTGTQSSTTELRPMGAPNSPTVGGGMGLPSSGGRIQATSGAPSVPRAPPPLPFAPRSPPHYHVHNTQTQTKGQGHHHPTSSLPQPYSNGMPLHSPHLPPALAKNPLGMPLLHSGNSQPHLTNTNAQTHNGQFASHQIQTTNGIRFSEETHTLDNNGGENNGFGNTGKTTTKSGSFSWTSPEGQLYEVNYVADALGFRPTGTHILTPSVKTRGPNEPMGGHYEDGQAQFPHTQGTQRSPSFGAQSPTGTSAYSYTDFRPTTHFQP